MPSKSNRNKRGLPFNDTSPVSYACVPIPDDPQFRALLLGAIQNLSLQIYYDRDPLHRGQIVAAFWANYFSEFREAIVNLCGDTEQGCVTISPLNPMIEWFPCHPTAIAPDLPPNYEGNPFVVVDSGEFPQLTGLGNGDVYSDILHLPAPPLNPLDIPEMIAAGLPRFSLHLFGSGIVRFEMLNLLAGGLALFITDENILSAVLVDCNLDIASLPPETSVAQSVEFVIEGEGEHTIDCHFAPVFNDELLFLKWGAGLRSIELCGFEVTMPIDPCCDDELEYLLKIANNTSEILATLRAGFVVTPRILSMGLPDKGASDCSPIQFGYDPSDVTQGEKDIRLAALCLAVERFVAWCILQQAIALEATSTVYANLALAVASIPFGAFAQAIFQHVADVALSDLQAITGDEPAIEDVQCAIYLRLASQQTTWANFQNALSLYEPAEGSNEDKIATLVKAQLNNADMFAAFDKELGRAQLDIENGLVYVCPCAEFPVSVTLVNNGHPEAQTMVLTQIDSTHWRIEQPTIGESGLYVVGIRDLYNRCFNLDEPDIPPHEATPSPFDWQFWDCAGIPDSGVGGITGSEGIKYDIRYGSAVDMVVKVTLAP